MTFIRRMTQNSSRHCKICESHDHNTEHHERYALKSKVRDKGFPTNSRRYLYAHEQADKAEKSAYPKGYEKLKPMVRDLPKGELLGKNTKSGKIEVSKRVPPKLRNELAYHEKVENKILRKKK